jgi:hypothetical protein
VIRLHRLPDNPYQVVAEGGLLREAEVRSREPLPKMIVRSFSVVTAHDARGYFEPRAYHPSDRPLFAVLVLGT